MTSTLSTSFTGILPTELTDYSSPFGTDRYVEEAIHRAETGRRTWKILAILVLFVVALIAATST
jgi:hypothetical protein